MVEDWIFVPGQIAKPSALTRTPPNGARMKKHRVLFAARGPVHRLCPRYRQLHHENAFLRKRSHVCSFLAGSQT